MPEPGQTASPGGRECGRGCWSVTGRQEGARREGNDARPVSIGHGCGGYALDGWPLAGELAVS